MKTKYIIGTLILGSISLFSELHSERYSIIIPIIFGVLTIFSIAIGLPDKKKV